MMRAPRDDQARRLSRIVGVLVLAMAMALGAFIASQPGDPSPPEDVPRALAIPALYATMGLLAIIGAWRRRPAIVVAAGVLCLIGAIVSVATIPFVVPGVLLLVLGARIRAAAARHGPETVIAVAAVVLVVGAAASLLGLTEQRCWAATGSRASPTYTVIQCDDQGSIAAGSDIFATGLASGVLSSRGGLVAAALLLGALTLAVATGRSATGRGVESAMDTAT
jgi:hypothetical protein